MTDRPHPGLAVLGLLVLLAGLAVELAEPGVLLEDLGVLAIVGALTLLASVVPALMAGRDAGTRPDTPPPR